MANVRLEDLITLKNAAVLVGCRSGVLSKLAKKGEVPGAIQVLGRWGFDPAALVGFEAPKGTGRKGGFAKRPDGRHSYRIYLTPEEAKTLVEAGYEVIDPAVARAARKAKKAAEVEAVPIAPTAAQDGYAGAGAVAAVAPADPNADPFAAFGTD